MALRIPTRLEVGQRVRWLRRQANYSGRDLARAIGATDTGIMTKIEKHGESFDFERVMKIAKACAGRGQLVDDDELLYDFLMGRIEDQRILLRPQFSLVGTGDGATSSLDATVAVSNVFEIALVTRENASLPRAS